MIPRINKESMHDKNKIGSSNEHTELISLLNLQYEAQNFTLMPTRDNK